jgi:predicted RNase H-like HicB family nuclease
MGVKSYIYRVEMTHEDDGRWSAVVPALPGCTVWGYTSEEAIEAIREAAQAYIEILIEDGRPVPLEEAQSVVEGPAVAVVA